MPIGIIGALEEEIRALVQAVENLQESKWAKQSLYQGVIGDCEVVLASSGVGKVKAAACTQYLIDRFPLEMMISMGVAGAVNDRLGIGHIVVSRKVLQHDVDLGEPALMRRVRRRWLKADPGLVELAVEVGRALGVEDRMHVGAVLTGDQAIASAEKRQWLWETFRGDCVDMESAAVAQVCRLNRVPFVIVLAISDSALEESVEEFKQSLVTSAADAARVVLEMMGRIRSS